MTQRSNASALLWAVFALAFGLVLAACSPSSGPPQCAPETCAGCCDAELGCLAGDTALACGHQGGACATCGGGLACLAGACGFDPAVDGGAGGPFDRWCRQFAALECARLAACGDVSQADGPRCEAIVLRLDCGAGAAGVPPRLASGALTFDPGAAGACLDGVRDAGPAACHTVQNCPAAIVAAAASGGPCTADADCADASQYCAGAMACGRTCQPRPAGGGACGAGCPQGLGCDAVLERCLPPTADGGLGAECTGDQLRCRDGLRCVRATPPGDGGAGQPGQCATPQLGDACLRHGDCPAAAHCADAGTCRLSSLASPCDASGQCPAGAFCTADGGLCQQRAAPGAACGVEAEACAPPAVCLPRAQSSLDGVCGAPRGPGSACAVVGGRGVGCRPFEACLGGTCIPVGDEGQRCDEAGGCLGLACQRRDEDAGVPGVCEGLGGEGAACTSGRACASGICAGGCVTCPP